MKRQLVLFFFCGTFFSLYAQRSVPDSLAFTFRNQLKIFPQEKIYVHTDKPYYIYGEKIWFRVYLADAMTHEPASISQYVYVELINSLDSVITRVKIRETEEAYHGYLLIPNDALEDDYTLRAYTAFMCNQGEEEFFTKNIHIGDPQSVKVSVNNGRTTPVSDHDFDVGFYPEGGFLMESMPCKVGVKAMKSSGQATEVSGVVFNRSGVEVARFTSDYLGMGAFMIAAQSGESYYALCENDRGQSKRFELPAAVHHGYVLAVNQIRDHLHISVRKPAGVEKKEELYLLAHTRGMIHLIDQWNHETNAAIIAKVSFPSGVLHLILFDAGLNPLSERLVFVNNNDQAQIVYQTDKERYTVRSLVKNRVVISDNNGQPISGNFSVSVTSDREVTPDSTTNILTQLLLTSDLRGDIENPAYYFQDRSESSQALDLLMLTQGWRRFNLTNVVQGQYTWPTFPLELGTEVSGVVKSQQLGRPVEEVEVSVSSLIYGYYNSANTDKNGRFQIPTGEFPDSTRFIVSVTPRRGLTNMELQLDKEIFPKRTLSFIPYAEQNKSQFAQYVEKAEQQYLYEGGIRITQLSAAVVTADRKAPVPRRSYYYAPPEPQNSLTEEQLDRFPSLSIYQALSRFHGVQVAGKLVSLVRSSRSTFSDGLPLVLFNDMPLPFRVQVASSPPEYVYTLDGINMIDVAHIDILTGSASAAFGSSGMYGVISIFTRNAEDIRNISSTFSHIKSFYPIGYQQYAEFYAPKYESEAQRYNSKPDLRTTIHWQPVVEIDNRGSAEFEFYTSDEPTSYSVVIEGLGNEGQVIRHVEKIDVSQNQ